VVSGHGPASEVRQPSRMQAGPGLGFCAVVGHTAADLRPVVGANGRSWRRPAATERGADRSVFVGASHVLGIHGCSAEANLPALHTRRRVCRAAALPSSGRRNHPFEQPVNLLDTSLDAVCRPARAWSQRSARHHARYDCIPRPAVDRWANDSRLHSLV